MKATSRWSRNLRSAHLWPSMKARQSSSTWRQHHRCLQTDTCNLARFSSLALTRTKQKQSENLSPSAETLCMCSITEAHRYLMIQGIFPASFQCLRSQKGVKIPSPTVTASRRQWWHKHTLGVCTGAWICKKGNGGGSDSLNWLWMGPQGAQARRKLCRYLIRRPPQCRKLLPLQLCKKMGLSYF